MPTLNLILLFHLKNTFGFQAARTRKSAIRTYHRTNNLKPKIFHQAKYSTGISVFILAP